jgi:hypothetical protein
MGQKEKSEEMGAGGVSYEEQQEQKNQREK